MALMAIGAMILAAGAMTLATAGVATAGNVDNSNDAPYWEALGYGDCEKLNYSTENGGFTMPDPPAGSDWTLLVIKAGSGEAENTLHEDPVAGQTYTHATKPGVSHVIVCSDTPAGEEPDCTDAEYAAEHPEECGEGEEPDCTDAEYAAEHPEECGEGEEPDCTDAEYAAEHPEECDEGTVTTPPSPEVLGSESSSPRPDVKDDDDASGSTPRADVPVVLGTSAAVPTAVDAGIGGPTSGGTGDGGTLLAGLLIAAGAALTVAGGWLGYGGRRRGAHQG